MNTEGAFERLEKFRTFEVNWDSYDGLPIAPAAIDKARQLLKGLFVCPLSSGEVGISLGDEEITLRVTQEGGVVLEIV